MKKLGKGAFIIVVTFIFVFAYLAFFGVDYTDEYGREYKLVKGVSDISRGIDIMGGISVSFGSADGEIVSDEQLERAKEIILSRLSADNVTDYEIYTDSTADRIILSFPWQEGVDSSAENLIVRIAKQAKTLICDGTPADISQIVTDDTGIVTGVIDSGGNVFSVCMSDADIFSSSVMSNSYGDKAVVITFTELGKSLFAEATARNMGGSISFWTDGELLYSLPVDHIITAGRTVIGREIGFTQERAQEISHYFNTGAIPFELKAFDYEVLKATLGDNALEAMVIAGIIAFIVICCFMIWRYRLPGVVACFSLLGLVAIVLAAVSGFLPFFNSLTLTLPGIAGIILAIGMGVDASIITSERIKEEIIKGKSIDISINSGINNSFTSIFDSNVTITIVAVILLGIFGPPETVWNYILYAFVWFLPDTTTGPIYSFGYTLLAGVVANYIMGIFASRIMLKSLASYEVFHKRELFGGENE